MQTEQPRGEPDQRERRPACAAGRSRPPAARPPLIAARRPTAASGVEVMERERGHGDVHGAVAQRQRGGVGAHEGDLRIARRCGDGPAPAWRRRVDARAPAPAGRRRRAQRTTRTARSPRPPPTSTTTSRRPRRQLGPPRADASERERVAAEPGVEPIEVVERRAADPPAAAARRACSRDVSVVAPRQPSLPSQQRALGGEAGAEPDHHAPLARDRAPSRAATRSSTKRMVAEDMLP